MDNLIDSFFNLKVKKINQIEVKRKNVDYPWTELVVYIVCYNCPVGEIINFSDIIIPTDIEQGYIDDLNKANKQKVVNYYNIFYNAYKKIKGDTLKKVYLVGKNQHKFPEIVELNKDAKAKLTADIYVETAENFIGISVKSSFKDTFTNYSIYKILNLFYEGKIIKQKLNDERDKILKSNNLELTFSKKNRKIYNRIFRNINSIDNDYHILLNKIILENSEEFIYKWYSDLFGDLPYNLYTFDGNQLTNYKPSKELITIKSIQNPSKNPKGASKLFYAVYINFEIIYKWEIRWKGNIFVSPQILTYKWNELTDNLKLL